jgi:hypothetical protein
MRTTHIRLVTVSFSLLGLLMAGCQPQAPSSPALGSQTDATSATKPLSISEVRVNKGQGDSRAGAPLTTTDPIVVALKTIGTAKGVELEAKLFDLSNGQVAARQAKRIVTDTPSTTELIFKSDNQWAAGRYLLEIKLDGKLAEQRDIDIVAAKQAKPR